MIAVHMNALAEELGVMPHDDFNAQMMVLDRGKPSYSIYKAAEALRCIFFD